MDASNINDRRMDSIAWLLQADNTCGACCFDGSHLLMSINISNEPNLSSCWILEKYFHNIANYCHRSLQDWNKKKIQIIKQATENPAEIDQPLIELIKKESKDKKIFNERMKNISDYLSKSRLYLHNHTFSNSCDRSLKKITRSIKHAYLRPGSPKSLAQPIAEAIQAGRIRILTQGENGLYLKKLGNNTLHAEMAILNDLWKSEKLNERRYIGVSKRCCLVCFLIIRSVNHVLSQQKQQPLPLSSETKHEPSVATEEDIIVIRGDHSHVFPCYCPPFLEPNDQKINQIREHFLQCFKDRISNYLVNDRTFSMKNNEIDADRLKSLTFNDAFSIKETTKLRSKEKKEKARSQLHLESKSGESGSSPCQHRRSSPSDFSIEEIE